MQDGKPRAVLVERREPRVEPVFEVGKLTAELAPPPRILKRLAESPAPVGQQQGWQRDFVLVSQGGVRGRCRPGRDAP